MFQILPCSKLAVLHTHLIIVEIHIVRLSSVTRVANTFDNFQHSHFFFPCLWHKPFHLSLICHITVLLLENMTTTPFLFFCNSLFHCVDCSPLCNFFLLSLLWYFTLLAFLSHSFLSAFVSSTHSFKYRRHCDLMSRSAVFPYYLVDMWPWPSYFPIRTLVSILEKWRYFIP